LKFIKKFLKIY